MSALTIYEAYDGWYWRIHDEAGKEVEAAGYLFPYMSDALADAPPAEVRRIEGNGEMYPTVRPPCGAQKVNADGQIIAVACVLAFGHEGEHHHAST